MPELERWHVIVTSPKLVEEIRKAPDDVLSLSYYLDEVSEPSQSRCLALTALTKLGASLVPCDSLDRWLTNYRSAIPHTHYRSTTYTAP